MIDRHYGGLARNGGEHAINLLDGGPFARRPGDVPVRRRQRQRTVEAARISHLERVSVECDGGPGGRLAAPFPAERPHLISDTSV
jgi:hypothetical protein